MDRLKTLSEASSHSVEFKPFLKDTSEFLAEFRQKFSALSMEMEDDFKELRRKAMKIKDADQRKKALEMMNTILKARKDFEKGYVAVIYDNLAILQRELRSAK